MAGWAGATLACGGIAGDASRTRLPDPCENPPLTGTRVTYAGLTLAGRLEDVRDLTSALHPNRLAVLTSEGLYTGQLTGDSLIIDRRLAGRGQETGAIVELTAVTEGPVGVLVYDRQTSRITVWDSIGQVRSAHQLARTAWADAYVAGGGEILALTSERGPSPYASVTGALETIDDEGYPDSVVLRFPSLALRAFSTPSGAKLLRRPLEHQPIVRWSPSSGWAIASTDSLHLVFGGAPGRRPIHATGDRARITAAARDSSLDELAVRTGFQGEDRATAREYSRIHHFENRDRLQLIDDVLPFADGWIAVRRMHRCGDRAGWNLLDSAGAARPGFAVPLGYRAVLGLKGAALFLMTGADGLVLVRVRIPMGSGHGT